MPGQSTHAPATTYSGPTDHYGTAHSAFAGPYARGARILAVDTVQVGPANGPRRSAVRLLLTNTSTRGPRTVSATVDTPARAWAVHPDADQARPIVAVLTASGIPAGLTVGDGGEVLAAVTVATRTGARTLRLAMRDTLQWQLDGAQAAGRWPGTRLADAPACVRRWLRVAKAHPSR